MQANLKFVMGQPMLNDKRVKPVSTFMTSTCRIMKVV
jgi:hypothetical protein